MKWGFIVTENDENQIIGPSRHSARFDVFGFLIGALWASWQRATRALFSHFLEVVAIFCSSMLFPVFWVHCKIYLTIYIIGVTLNTESDPFSLCPQHAQMAESELLTLLCPFNILFKKACRTWKVALKALRWNVLFFFDAQAVLFALALLSGFLYKRSG